jgi:Protein of unknown function (DUF1549)/Protein of unknown function (DUF1553)
MFSRSLVCLALVSSAASAAVTSITVDPVTVQLQGSTASYSLLVQGQTPDGRTIDLTRNAHFSPENPAVARVTPAGVIHAAGDGKTTVRVEIEGKTLPVAVEVTGTTLPRQVTYVSDVLPIFSRYGCNGSGCHGKSEGQNGFKLSVFGFDPAADLASLTREARGRRIFFGAPEASVLLRKMSGQMAHGGGSRIPRGSADYETVRAWIAAGAPLGLSTDPVVQAVRVEPAERLLWPRDWQQLRVIARYSDGRERDVTAHARFQSNNEGLINVQPSGLVRAGEVPGEAAVMASFMNEVAVFRVLVPRTETIANYPAVVENNFIDRLVFAKLRKLNVAPSELADDAEYLRRVYLDLIGTLPTPAEARQFLADRRPDRRTRLVDELLQRPEFADFWAQQWADLLRVDRGVLGPKRAYSYHRWIRESIAANMPYDRFARAVLTAEGLLAETPQAGFYRVVTKPGEEASSLSQVFLGVRIACAECHHHPFDRWSQQDYYGMQAYFAGVAIRPGPHGESLAAEGPAVARIPRTGEAVPAFALGEKMPDPKVPAAVLDPRQNLADWMTRPDNPWFARNLANRMWAHLMGRGLVEPVDDVRATNPPSNPELLAALGQNLVESRYDMRALIRTITASRVYQLSSRPNATNERDELNYSRALFKRIGAEVLCDMVSQTTGVTEKFSGAPTGTRAIQLWDSKVPHYFLKVFGRPERLSACECERNHEPSVAQVLHLLNAPEINARISHEGGTVARLCKRQPDDALLIEELYLTYYSRLPTDRERQRALAHMVEHKDRRRQGAEDLAWSMLNSLEFLFNH